MLKAKRLNSWRRETMRKLTRNIGQSDEVAKPIEHSQIKKVLICRPNHRLGNMLLITPLVTEVSIIFPKAEIDLFVKGGVAPIVFQHYTGIHRIFGLPKKTFKQFFKYVAGWIKLKLKHYDLVINVIHYSASGKISTKIARAEHKFFGRREESQLKEYPDYQHAAKYPVYALRDYLEEAGLAIPHAAVPLMDLRLSEEEKLKGAKTLKALTSNNKKTISIFTYATGDKRFSKSWWNAFYSTLRKRYPDYNIVEVLPVENVSQIDFQAPSFYSKDIREIGAFIAATAIFIGADSGMMHLASAAQAPTVGLFSVTKTQVYKPYGNGSVAIEIDGSDFIECLSAIDEIL